MRRSLAEMYFIYFNRFIIRRKAHRECEIKYLEEQKKAVIKSCLLSIIIIILFSDDARFSP